MRICSFWEFEQKLLFKFEDNFVENATEDIIDFERHIEAATFDDVEVD